MSAIQQLRTLCTALSTQAARDEAGRLLNSLDQDPLSIEELRALAKGTFYHADDNWDSPRARAHRAAERKFLKRYGPQEPEVAEE